MNLGFIAGWGWLGLGLAGWLDPLSSWPGDGLAGGGLGDTFTRNIHTFQDPLCIMLSLINPVGLRIGLRSGAVIIYQIHPTVRRRSGDIGGLWSHLRITVKVEDWRRLFKEHQVLINDVK